MNDSMIPKNLASLYIDITCTRCGRLMAFSNSIQRDNQYLCPNCALFLGTDELILDPLMTIKDKMAKDIFNTSITEAHEKGTCISCGRIALEHCYSGDGRKEYQISGLCEECFDEIRAEE